MPDGSRTNTKAMMALLLAVALLLVLNGRFLESVREDEAVLPPPEEMPPTLYLTTVALGPARTMVSNMLWWRAVRMQDEGNYFEAIQLANWISQLQPRLPNVWTYQSWNMAFNLTAEMPNPEDRYVWVKAGFELLRDEGLRYNPRDPYIQTEMSRLIFQKMADTKDPHWRYYMRRWAQEMYRYFPDGTEAELVTIITSPDELDALRADAAVAKLIDAAAALELDLLDLDMHEREHRWTEPQRALVASAAGRATLRKVRYYLVKKAIVSELKMDPEHMLYIQDRYGPFDWRLPQAHAVYWGANESFDTDERNEDFQLPIVRQAMVKSFMMGRLVYLDQDELITTNNLEIAANVDDYLHELLENRPTPGVKSLGRDFHRDGAVILYVYMQEDAARSFHQAYRDFLEPNDPNRRQSFEAFISTQGPSIFFKDTATADPQSLVLGTLMQAYLWLALQEPQRARGFFNMAGMLHSRHQAEYAERPDLMMPPFEELQQVAYDLAMGDNSPLPPQVQQNLRIATGGNAVEVPLPTQGKPEAMAIGAAHAPAATDEDEAP